ncbi:hypothetical protein BDZ90DRAFT_6568 [Jaminaea rosea]|uniref:Uncharacterized protein n=1 Tax=Jaminaea rosea TaxID=1569628 RepID=A0A316UYW2_9BASI|nr:hypothetical protein BDZ90DRAFT_6568 [Jaminaea rosea]PWN30184.1 hypothetical protein BDZ90DRAFT_6568 [Jaminaea rosea]
MLATMRPSSVQSTNLHQQPPSRASSIASSHHSSKSTASSSNHRMAESAIAKPKTAAKRPNNKSGAAGGHKATHVSSEEKQGSGSNSPRPRSKKALPSHDEVHLQAMKSTPGLLTLSKPLEEEAVSRKSTAKPKKDRKKAVAIDESTPEPPSSSIHHLSSSAPETSRPLSKRSERAAPERDAAAWEMPSSGGSAQGQPALNWQQQLMNAQPSGNKAATISAAATKKAARKQAQQSTSSASSDALTWQQELFNPAAKAKRGPQFDVFADARDVETFGGVSEDESSRSRTSSVGELKAGKTGKKAGKGGKKVSAAQDIAAGDLSLDEIFAAGPGSGSASTGSNSKSHIRIQSMPPGAGGPSTPAKRANPPFSTAHHASSPALSSNLAPPHDAAAAAAAAYAGPNFHNSPSAASLPAPKFGSRIRERSSALQRQDSRSSTSSGGGRAAGGSSDAEGAAASEVGLPRSARGATAPPAPMSSSYPSSGLPGSSSSYEAMPADSSSSLSSNDPASSGANKSSAPSTMTMDKSATIENLLARLMGGPTI